VFISDESVMSLDLVLAAKSHQGLLRAMKGLGLSPSDYFIPEPESQDVDLEPHAPTQDDFVPGENLKNQWALLTLTFRWLIP